jgi:5-formyltetrahydrofolate cyclo-ligase
MLEPPKSKQNIPDVMLVPLLVFDKDKHRLGYGKGFYDRYLNRHLKKFKDILTIGVAFSFQKLHKLPINNKDVKLNYILTEKGIYK